MNYENKRLDMLKKFNEKTAKNEYPIRNPREKIFPVVE
jgi:hypothetical protein